MVTRFIRCRRAALYAVLGVFAAIVHADDSADSWAEILLLELARGRSLPTLSVYHDALDFDAAYAIQRAFALQNLRTRKVGGFKAAFTSAALREQFRTAEPASAVLFADGRVEGGAEVDLAKFKRPLLEVEIGYVVRSPIRRRMRSVEDLSTYVRHAVPVVELPDMNYVNPTGLNARDIIATNIAASHYVVGQPFALQRLSEVNSLTVELKRDRTVIDRGKAFEAMGNQLEALLWLVNQLVRQGWEPAPGQVLITGTLGRINPALPGRYVADYGAAGRLEFTLGGGRPGTRRPTLQEATRTK